MGRHRDSLYLQVGIAVEGERVSVLQRRRNLCTASLQQGKPFHLQRQYLPADRWGPLWAQRLQIFICFFFENSFFFNPTGVKRGDDSYIATKIHFYVALDNVSTFSSDRNKLKYNVISTYSLLTYIPTNVFTVHGVQLRFSRLHRELLRCPCQQ